MRSVSVCLILAIVVEQDLELHQMDVKMTFLNVALVKRAIWINQLVLSSKDKIVEFASSNILCLALNEQWYLRFYKAITLSGFLIVEEDQGVYVK